MSDVKLPADGKCGYCGADIGYAPQGEYCSAGCGYIDGYYWPRPSKSVMSDTTTLAEAKQLARDLSLCSIETAMLRVVRKHDAEVRRKDRAEINDWVTARAKASEITIDDSVTETEARVNVAMTLAEDRARRKALEDLCLKIMKSNGEPIGRLGCVQLIRSLIDKEK